MKIDIRDAKMMFQDCILLFNGALRYVAGMDNEVASLREVNADPKRIIESHNNFDAFSPIKTRLGYINYGPTKSAIYLERMPIRQFKIGLTSGNIRMCSIHSRHAHQALEAFPRIDGLEQCLNNKYPSLKAAITAVIEKGFSSVAFDKQFAVSTEKRVYYKNTFVGTFDEETHVIALHPQYQYLESVMIGAR